MRKGLPQAIAAVNGLRQLGHAARLLVIGGTERTIAEFRQRMRREGLPEDFVRFAGMVSPPEQHFAAGDAFLFPSHFEAFSLVEIEAAALGMRLYLTDHPGSEMILREGVNGKILPWDVPGMTRLLDEEIRSGLLKQPHHEMGEALTPDAYAIQLSRLFSQAIERKCTHP
ncbi:MAG: glycosyltransferase [Luteolibacter sp.]